MKNLSVPKWIDTHGHVNSKAFLGRHQSILDQALLEDVWVVMPGFQHATSERGIRIAEEYEEGVYAALGFHPTHVGDPRMSFSAVDYEKFLPHPKVVAIGECGLDYYRIDRLRFDELQQKQIDVLKIHIDLATRYDLPLITHCRDAYEDLLVILREAIADGKLPRRGVIHCYVSNWEIAQQFLDLGFLISFTGIITFTKDSGLIETVQKMPLDRMMVETDSPYLSPEPFRGKQNTPLRVKWIGEKIAELRDIPVSEVSYATTQNAKVLFKIGS